jgi:hypothetical protein
MATIGAEPLPPRLPPELAAAGDMALGPDLRWDARRSEGPPSARLRCYRWRSRC